MNKKFWVVQGGVVGTAHIDRDGRTVDFRPARVEVKNGFVVVRPPRGQNWLESVHLEPTRTEKRVTSLDRDWSGEPKPGMKIMAEFFFAKFLGVEISVQGGSRSEWYDKEAEKEFLKKIREREEELTAQWHAVWKKRRDFLSAISLTEMVEKATRQDVGRLRDGCPPQKVMEIILKILFIKKFPDEGCNSLCGEEALRRDAEEFRAAVLFADDVRRAERKERYIAAKKRG